MVKLTVVLGGLEGDKLEVSRQSLRLPIVASKVGWAEDIVIVVRFSLSSYLGDQRESGNVVDCLVEIAGVANLVVDASGDVCKWNVLWLDRDWGSDDER
jgi:hypothetical protein